MTVQPSITTSTLAGRLKVVAGGTWTIAFARELEALVAGLPAQSGDIDIAAVERLDTFGAWLLEDVMRRRGGQLALAAVPDRFRGLLDEVSDANREAPEPRRRRFGPVVLVEAVGEAVFGAFREVNGADQHARRRGGGSRQCDRASALLARHLDHPSSRPRRLSGDRHHRADDLPGRLHHFAAGHLQLPPLRRRGYVVNLLGILVLREIGVLLVTIMVAGRSGSSYTAELGSMKMREEVDALRTMGVDPAEVLILPRVVALVIAMPVLTFLGSMAALMGGGLVAWFYGGMSPEIFIFRLREAVSVHDFLVGMIKAPAMALVVGVIACTEGMRVEGSAESLGLKTTTSVVKSIFTVIVLDGLFAMFFAAIGW